VSSAKCNSISDRHSRIADDNSGVTNVDNDNELGLTNPTVDIGLIALYHHLTRYFENTN
jgi:hypothetical protein